MAKQNVFTKENVAAWFKKEFSNDRQTAYLPDERPPLWKLFLYAIQQIIVMFPATVLVALITGFQVSTTIFARPCNRVLYAYHGQKDTHVLWLQLCLSYRCRQPYDG
ncbi:MAG TPA: hypothetical protein PKH08_04970 [Clostridia bacterium]|nr:hypothetical protein [Clostridia bacterium]